MAGTSAVILVLLSIVASRARGQLRDFGIFKPQMTVGETPCEKQLNVYFEDLNNGKAWAWEMFDASSKWNYGIFTGNKKDYGSFDECLDVDHVDETVGRIHGKHCMFGFLMILPNPIKDRTPYDHNTIFMRSKFQAFIDAPDSIINEKSLLDNYLIISLSICIPNECKPSDMKNYLANLKNVIALDNTCQVKRDSINLDTSDIIAIVIFSIIGLLVVSSTGYDYFLYKSKRESNIPVLVSFSVISNTKKLVHLSKNPDQLNCLAGIRTFSILWVMLGHRYGATQAVPMVNFNSIGEWMLKWYNFYVYGAPFAVETFFFVSGCVMAYIFIKSQKSDKAKFNVLLYYLHRYLRITPALGIVYLMHVSLLRYLTTGPTYAISMNFFRTACLDNWWSFFLYIQNYVNEGGMCLVHTWYLSVDMQFFILSPMLLYPLAKMSKKITIPVLWVLIVGAIVTEFSINYVYENDYNQSATHVKLTSWLVGIFAGAMIEMYKDVRIRIHWALNLAIWTVVLIAMFNVVFWNNTTLYERDRLGTAFYTSMAKFAWALGLTWIVFACTKGYGGFVNWFLSLPMFQMIARISYSMYLVHMTVIMVQHSRVRTVGYFSDYDVLYIAFGDIIVTLVLAFFWVVLFESPMIVLEKAIFAPPKKRRNDEKINSITITKS